MTLTSMSGYHRRQRIRRKSIEQRHEGECRVLALVSAFRSATISSCFLWSVNVHSEEKKSHTERTENTEISAD
jgi:hypothetical protein